MRTILTPEEKARAKVKMYHHEYYEAHKDHYKTLYKNKIKTPEEIARMKEYHKNYRIAHREYYRAKSKEWSAKKKLENHYAFKD